MNEIVRWSGLSPYQSVWDDMQAFTQARSEMTANQIWQVEHSPVYTLGQAGKPEHILNSGNIPIVHTNRGGQITYHGPGQVVIYPLVNLRRAQLFVREYVHLLEEAVLHTLAQFGVSTATRKAGAPGIYVPQKAGELAKIAALGVKVSNSCAYHGLALNVNMDLRPFEGINPCGYAGLRTIDMSTLGIHADWQAVADSLSHFLADHILW